MSFEHNVRRLQHEAGWSDIRLLGILLDFIGFYCPMDLQRRAIQYLNSVKNPDPKIHSGPGG